MKRQNQAIKKPRMGKHSELPTLQNAKYQRANSSILNLISKVITTINIGGNMSEQGADNAGLEISSGFKFFMKSCGIGIALALFLWKSPDFLNALAEFILTIKNAP